MSGLKKENIKELFSFSSGPSMYPTLKSGDRINIIAYKTENELKVGDVIVYPHPEKSFDVVHRVIKIRKDAIITRGDNNNKVDPYIVEFTHIKGKVKTIKRRGKTIPVIHGKTGYYLHRMMLLRKLIVYLILKPLRLLSALIDKSCLLNFLHPIFKLKKIAVNKRGKKEILLVHNAKVIGRKLDNSSWKVKFPYKYFIDKDKIE